MTTTGLFNTNLKTTVGLSSHATKYIFETKQLVLNFFRVILTPEFWAGQYVNLRGPEYSQAIAWHLT